MMMKRLKRLWSERQFEKYMDLLLRGKITLLEVPAEYRLKMPYARQIHIYAFRGARRVSKERYLDELESFRLELRDMPESRFKTTMEELLRDMQKNLRMFDTHNIKEFA